MFHGESSSGRLSASTLEWKPQEMNQGEFRDSLCHASSFHYFRLLIWQMCKSCLETFLPFSHPACCFCPAASLNRNYKHKTQDDLLWFAPYWIGMSPRVHSLQTVVCFVSQHSAVRAEGAHWHQHEQSVHWRDRPPEELWGPETVSIIAETNHCNGDRSFTASISPANSRLGTSDPFCPLVVKKTPTLNFLLS